MSGEQLAALRKWSSLLGQFIKTGRVARTPLGLFGSGCAAVAIGRNLRTSKLVMVPARRQPAFLPDARFLKRVLTENFVPVKDLRQSLQESMPGGPLWARCAAARLDLDAQVVAAVAANLKRAKSVVLPGVGRLTASMHTPRRLQMQFIKRLGGGP